MMRMDNELADNLTRESQPHVFQVQVTSLRAGQDFWMLENLRRRSVTSPYLSEEKGTLRVLGCDRDRKA